MARFTIKIDQLPEEHMDADGPREAARKTAELIAGNDHLRKLADDEPVQIKRPDGVPWGRNLTIGDVRAGVFDAIDDVVAAGEGPVRAAKP